MELTHSTLHRRKQGKLQHCQGCTEAQGTDSQIPEDDLPDPPYKAKSRAVMLMFVAGEHFPFHLYPDEDIATPIVESRDDLSLKNLCRKSNTESHNHEWKS